jgi:hypothetical protein
VNFGDLQAVGLPHPLGIDFRAANDRDFSDETPQRVPLCDVQRLFARGRHDGA